MIIMIVELWLFYLRFLSFSFSLSTTSRASLTVKPISINGFSNSDMFNIDLLYITYDDHLNSYTKFCQKKRILLLLFYLMLNLIVTICNDFKICLS